MAERPTGAVPGGDDAGAMRARFYEIRAAALMVDGRPTRPRFRVVPVAPSEYLRGAATREVTPAFMFEESLRLFNFGTTGTYHVRKRHDPLTGENIRKELVQHHGPLLSKWLYEHAKIVSSKGVNGTKDGKPKAPKIGKDVVAAPVSAGDVYFSRVLLDDHQNAILLPRLWCDDWASRAARPNVIAFKAIRDLHKDVLDRLRPYGRTLNVSERANYFRDKISLPAIPGSAMLGADRLGHAFTVTIGQGRAVDWLKLFAPGGKPEEIGLAERFHATLVLLRTMNVQAPPVPSLPMLWDQTLNDELAKLRATYPLATKPPPPYPVVRLKEGAWSQLDRWRATARTMTGDVLGFLRALPDVIPDPVARGPIHSDLMWGLIMLEFLHLLLLHLQLLTLYASVPFRQIYEGGYMAPLSRGSTVDGLSGPMAISLWEYFAYPGIDHAHGAHTSARNSFTDFPTYEPNWPGMCAEQTLWARDHAKGMLAQDQNRLAPITGALPDLAATSKEGTAVLNELNGPRRAVDLLAAANSERIGLKPTDTTWKKYREDLQVTLAATPGLDFRRRFPIPYPVNPEYHPSIFNLPSKYVSGETPTIDRKLFQSWGKKEKENFFATSQANHGAKLEAQLQAYVFAWLIDSWRRDRLATTRPENAAFPPCLVLTCGSALYGGRFTPHSTHRDGYGHDISLTTLKRPYHCSTFWPEVDEESPGKINLGNRSFAWQLATGLQASPAIRAVALRNALGALRQNARTHPELRTLLKTIFDLRTGSNATEMPPKVERMKISSIVPKDALVVSGFDFYQLDRPAQTTHPDRKPPRFAYRELLREALQQEWKDMWKMLSTLEDAGAIDSGFAGIEARLRDWPVFPDNSSHVSHHAAHAALILSQPAEIIWGAPLYHVRALRAIAKAFFDAGKGNVFDRKGATPTDDRPLAAFPEFHFLPHNHHHHWHVNFWREHHGLPKRFTTRTHAEHIKLTHPLWANLGVDFGGFLYYLKQLIESLKEAAGRKTRDPNGAEPIVKAAVLMSAKLNKLQAAQTEEARTAGAALRNAIFETCESMGLADVGLSTNSWTITRLWPVPNSRLDQVIKKSEKIHARIGTALTEAEQAARRSSLTNERLDDQREAEQTAPTQTGDTEAAAGEAVQRAEDREAFAEEAADSATQNSATPEPTLEDPDIDDRAGARGEPDIMDTAGSL